MAMQQQAAADHDQQYKWRERCCSSWGFWADVLMCTGLLLFAGMLSGLTLGLMSLSLLDLQLLLKSTRPQDRIYAAKIIPILKHRHLLLCTLLTGNALAMEALPIFLDELIDEWGALMISVTLVVMFGEILPKAVCSRHGLAVGATTTPLVRLLLILFFPVTYPISKMLDFMLGTSGAHDRSLLRRPELITLVSLHGKEAGKGGELSHHETAIITGALQMSHKTAQDAMVPLSLTFAVDADATLDRDLMSLIIAKGYSRVPIYSGSPSNLIGLLLVKNLLAARPGDKLAVRQLASSCMRRIPRVEAGQALYSILAEFRKGHSHMATVVIRRRRSAGHAMMISRSAAEAAASDDEKNEAAMAMAMAGKLVIRSSSSCCSNRKRDQGADAMDLSEPEADHDHRMEGSSDHSMGGRQIDEADGDDDLELQEDDDDQEAAIGIITMEDVIEELLQEDILDEADIYNYHHRRF